MKIFKTFCFLKYFTFLRFMSFELEFNKKELEIHKTVKFHPVCLTSVV